MGDTTTEEPASKTLHVSERDDDKLLTQGLAVFPFYHGFLPREDLPILLKNEGDYLMRISEVEAATKNSKQLKRDIVLSVMAEVHGCHGHGTTADDLEHCHDTNEDASHLKVRRKNVVVRHIGSMYFIEAAHRFDSVQKLLDYYGSNYGAINKMRFMLKSPVKLQEWEILHSDITLGKLLGQGAFGEVRAGVYKKNKETIDVAVKLTKGTNDLCKAKIKEMMREARVMRNLRHKNVVRIYGIAVIEQPLYIVMELIKGGALDSYLVKNKGKVPKREKLDMCYMAALGIEFLHNQKCIHRDLAARNCLYTNDKVVKISDFGLARIANSYVIKVAMKLPIKWLAPETISTLVFSNKTDVYSYGVLVYEIFSDGTEPWSGRTNADVKRLVCDGKQLEMPKECPEKLRRYTAERIWNKHPEHRATMTEIVRYFETGITDSSYIPLKMNR